ncbi:putative bifunctional diguanylate cyclase/phosphodiesterase [Idiomarina tyrosinivorans]|nr:bifunctional diguanylate cyclase/phosphodiesterase [Idiomarina tyrosinivorans]
MADFDVFTGLTVTTFSYAIQALLLFGLSFLLRYYFQLYGHVYLRFWAIASAVFAFNQLAFAGFSSDLINAHWLGSEGFSLLKSLAHTSLYLAITLLTIGAIDILYQRQLGLKLRLLCYAVAVAIAVLTYTLSSHHLRPGVPSFGMLVSKFLPMGIALVVIGFALLNRIKQGLGPRLISGSFIAVGIKNLGLLIIIAVTQDELANLLLLSFQGLLNCLFVAAAALGVVIWLLESERDSAVVAIQQAEYLNTHDSLTGVPNREQLVSKIPLLIESCRSSGRHLTVMLIGLNRFKAINETLGLRGGDRVLKEIAHRLIQIKPQPLAVARIGGDVYAVVFNHLKRKSFIIDLAEQLRATVNAPLNVDGKNISVHCGIGISRYPQHGHRAELLLNKATVALAQTKGQSNEATVIYQRGMDDEYTRLVDLEPVLKHALQTDQFELYLQPQFSTQSQSTVSFEALIRWNHPEQGVLGPAEFLPYIEQLGLSIELDDWVLENAAKLLQRWQQRYQRTWPIAVNLSAPHFQHAALVEKLHKLAQQYHIPHHQLELEITESVAMSDINNGMNVISQLRDAGFSIAIDDFGTGYSSLAYLRKLPIQKIKIDRSFIHELDQSRDDTTIVRTLIRLAHGLGKSVVAEGVETEQQLRILQALDCDLTQGYFHSAPVSQKHLSRWLDEAVKPRPTHQAQPNNPLFGAPYSVKE